MPYIDQAFYNDVYKGIPMDAETFTMLEARASDVVDVLTNYRLAGEDLSHKPELIRTNVKKAVAAQIEYMYSEGGELSVHGGSPSSVSIGGFSYTEGSGVKVVSEMARSYLRPTGLLYMGVEVRC
ncbi:MULTISPECIES: hypothetical protein [Cytobacillus]|uniref:Protein gp8 n=1 Tax=Cytobacillus oceanisediminis TaxID=665099 RepID=A0ABX3CK41_9BACI|nr:MULTISPECIES: hypothetical protein [Cytobacillus]MBX9972134.1 hypothetical protein [Cytobacillus firmus]OHX38833.1 hypothetical protein BBV17_04815 [Cytobacillus oceanisediminis]